MIIKQFHSNTLNYTFRAMMPILVLLFVLSGCTTQNSEKEKVVTVSIAPQKFFTKNLLPDNYEVNIMVPPGASPATYEPSTRQLQKLQKSGAYIRIGEIEFEKVWMDKINSINPELPVYNASAGIHFIEGSKYHHDHGHHHHERDPHIWTSPEKGKIILKNTARALKEVFPSDSNYIRKKYLEMSNELNGLDQKIKAMLKPYAGRPFLIYHPALSYFANDYNLKQLSIEQLGKEPSASDMADILHTARENNIHTVFIQEQFNQQSAKTIAAELDAKVVTINPLDENWDQAMLDIAEKIKATFR